MNHPTTTSKGSARTRRTTSPIAAHVDTPRRPPQDVPTDPSALWHVRKRILFHVAKNVRQAVRLQLKGYASSCTSFVTLGVNWAKRRGSVRLIPCNFLGLSVPTGS